jgi:mitochondrial cardiolipin hydrolase
MRRRLVGLALLVAGVNLLAHAETCTTQSYFVSPASDGGARSTILRTLDGAKVSMDIALSSFTDPQLGDAVVQASSRGASLRVILAESAAAEAGGQYGKLIAAQVPVELAPATTMLSHRFAVVDGTVLLTGSYEWLDPRSQPTYGSLTVVRCGSGTVTGSAVADFGREFNRLWLALAESPLEGDRVSTSELLLAVTMDVELDAQCIQLVSLMDTDLSIAGWALGDFEGQYVFPDGARLAPGEPFEVCIDTFNPTHDVTALYLDPAGDLVFLMTLEGEIVAQVEW